jgi:hypothetical protein
LQTQQAVIAQHQEDVRLYGIFKEFLDLATVYISQSEDPASKTNRLVLLRAKNPAQVSALVDAERLKEIRLWVRNESKNVDRKADPSVHYTEYKASFADHFEHCKKKVGNVEPFVQPENKRMSCDKYVQMRAEIKAKVENQKNQKKTGKPAGRGRGRGQ